MNILMIVPYPILPPDEGGRVRAWNILKALAAQDHHPVLFTPRDPAYDRADLPLAVHQLTPPGRRHQLLDPAYARRALAVARRERPDVIISEYPWPGVHAAWLARRLRLPLVLDAPNMEAERFRSTRSRAWRAVAVFERLVARAADAVFVASAEDRERFERAGVPAHKLQVVPNGIDPAALYPDPAAGRRVRHGLALEETTSMVLFIGQLAYPPNHEAVRILHDEILPRTKDTVFVVAGKRGADLARRYAAPRLRFVGAVDDVRPWLNAADAVVAPVTSGGGTRLKILEAIACGTPVVTTTVGAEGLSRTACGPLLHVADGWDRFAASLDRAAATPRPVKGSDLPAAFLDLYSWASIVRRIEWPRRRTPA